MTPGSAGPPSSAADRRPDGVTVRRDGAVVHGTLSNPGRRNAITWDMYDDLVRLCDMVDGDVAVRAVVLRGADDAFAAGTDIRQFTDFATGADGVAYERRVGAVLDRLLAVRVPVIGVVTGPAVGAGLAIACCCDVVLATPDARFGVPIARTLGNCIPAAVLGRLKDRLGSGRTMAMLMTARLLDAGEARTAGLVHDVLSQDELEEGVAAVVQRVTSGAPLTLAALKEMDRRSRPGLVDDEDLLERCYGSGDFREGVAAFLDHRRPTWQGR